jgi:hypothetical protein
MSALATTPVEEQEPLPLATQQTLPPVGCEAVRVAAGLGFIVDRAKGFPHFIIFMASLPALHHIHNRSGERATLNKK